MFALLLAAAFAGAASAQEPAPSGTYICEVVARAGIGAVHLEGAGSPRAFVDDSAPTRFAMAVAAPTAAESRYTVVEAPYDGPDRDRLELHTPNSVLHSIYVGDGADFQATEDLGVLRIFSPEDGRLVFWHSGFEYPGSVDTNLTSRWGTCELQG